MNFFHRFHRLILATATIIGTVIGVGIFALPYIASRAGVGLVLFYLLVLGGVVLTINLLYGEVVLRTDEPHRLAGYAEMYLGWPGKMLSTLSLFFGLFGALLAYMVLGGEFLSFIFGGALQPFLGSIILLLVVAYIVVRGLRTIGIIEVFMTVILLSLILGLVTYGSGYIDSTNLVFFGDSQNLFLPYGVVLFAIWGLSAVPEVYEFVADVPKRLKTVITLGTIIPIFIYAIFVIAVVGISGSSTSLDAVSGLVGFLGSLFSRYGALVGFLAVATSMMTIAVIASDSLRLDFNFPRWGALTFTFILPFILYFVVTRNFINIVGWVGAIALSLEGLMVLVIHSRAKKKGGFKPAYSINISLAKKILLALLFIAAIVYQIFRPV